MNITLSKTSLVAVVGTTLMDHAAGDSSLKQIVENVALTFNNDPSTKNFIHGDECEFIDDTKTTVSHHNPDMILEVDTGVLNSSCGNSGVCVEDASSSTGGRCIVTIAGTSSNVIAGPFNTIACQFADGKPGTKCDGFYACAGFNPAYIGCGSCNGAVACVYDFRGKYTNKFIFVGENSCNGMMACGDQIHSLVVQGHDVVIGNRSW